MAKALAPCPYVHNDECYRRCRGFECKHREEKRKVKVEPKPLTVDIPHGLTTTGRIYTRTREWDE